MDLTMSSSDLEGSWLSNQLLKVNKKSGGPSKEIERVESRQPPKGQKGKVKVRYKGWDEKFEEWLPRTSVLSDVMRKMDVQIKLWQVATRMVWRARLRWCKSKPVFLQKVYSSIRSHSRRVRKCVDPSKSK